MRTATISNGKFPETLAWSKETTAYCEKKFGLPKIHTWIDSFGTVGSIRWTMDFPDLATFEKAQAQILGDADYWKLVGKAAASGLIIDGTTHDVISRAL
jgi:hypothetical protein